MTIHTSHTLASAFNYLSENEVTALWELAKNIPKNNPQIVNIGAGSGTSGLAFVEARSEDIILTTIDIRIEPSPLGSLFSETEVLKKAEHYDTLVLEKRYQQYHGSSREVAKNLWNPDNKIDLLFIDGDHTEEGIRGDINNFMPHMAFNSIMCVHDYKKEESYRKNNPDEEITEHLKSSFIKPLFWVDKITDELLVPEYETILHIDTLIAFRIGDKINETK